MAFKSPTQVFEDFIELPVPVKGDIKVYRIEPVSITTGQYVQELSALIIAAQQGHEITEADQERLKLDDEQEQEFKKALLGDAYDLMVADGVSWEAMKIVTATVMRWVVADRAAAEEFWESQMVAAPNRRRGHRSGRLRRSRRRNRPRALVRRRPRRSSRLRLGRRFRALGSC